MPRRIFYSFHYENDCWRLQQIINMGAIEGQKILHGNEWEQIKRNPDGVRRWINEQMDGKSCVVVLIGSQTASREWVDYEIRRGWNQGKGLLGVHIHGLADRNGRTTVKGFNPFYNIKLTNGRSLSSLVPVYDPLGSDSSSVYRSIKSNLANWVEEAIMLRQNAA
jgi:hypothetical protein